MTMPPENVPPNELFKRLMAVPRPYRDVDIPRNDPETKEPLGKIRMWVLTQEEQEQCAAAAEEHTRKKLREVMKDLPKADEARRGYEAVYNNAASVEVLWRSCRRTDDPKWPFFPTTSELRKSMSADEIGVLMNHYYTVQDEVGPIVSRMSLDEEDAWLEVLAKGGSTLPLDSLSWGALKILALSLACRLSACLTDTSSAGAPPEDGGPSSSPPPPSTTPPDTETPTP